MTGDYDTSKNEKTSGMALIIASVLFLAISVYLHKSGTKFFYRIFTYSDSAMAITYDMPFPSRVIIDKFKDICPLYLKGYFLPVYLLLFPSILLLANGIIKLYRKNLQLFSFLENGKKEKIFLISVFLISFIIGILIHFKHFLRQPQFIDEYSYLFQSEVISDGNLYAKSPHMWRFFQCAHIVNDGKWFSKFTIGWPMILAMGRIVNLHYIIPPLFMAGSIILLYLVTKSLFNKTAGFVAVFLALISPFFIFTGVTFFSHTPQGFFILLSLYMIIRIKEGGGWAQPVIGALSIALVFLIRPGDGAIFFISILPYMCFVAYRSNWKKSVILKLIPVFAGFIIGIFLLLMSNRVQTGNPFLMGFLKYNPTEKIGFGSMDHTPLKGLYNYIFSSMRMAFWVVPLMTPGIIIALLKRKTVEQASRLSTIERYLLLIPGIAPILFYFFYYTIGNQEFGSRYYYISFILLIPLAAVGISECGEILKKWLPKNYFVPAFIIMTFVFMLIGTFTVIIPSVQKTYETEARYRAWLDNPPVPPGKSITFIRNFLSPFTNYYTRNISDYKDQKNILALFLMPGENRDLMKKFPDRKPYLVFTDMRSGMSSIIPYPDSGMETMENYIYASLNYKLSVRDDEKAVIACKKALDIDDKNPSPLLNLGLIYFEGKQYEKALKVFEKLSAEKPEISESRYYFGRCLGKTGKFDEAKKVLANFIKKHPGSHLAGRAEEWIEYYSNPLNRTCKTMPQNHK